VAAEVRRRMSKQDRHAQLLDVAQELIRADGTDALTLARLAERAGVAKPLVYDHFGTRSGVLVELYRAFESRQHAALDSALGSSPGDLAAVARVIADAYIGCALGEGTELPGLVAALAGSPELERVRREADQAFGAKCRSALLPFARSRVLPDAAVHAILGAAEGVARAVIAEEITADTGLQALTTVISALVDPRAPKRKS
jgi:AcrR family transcriptional regulator